MLGQVYCTLGDADGQESPCFRLSSESQRRSVDVSMENQECLTWHPAGGFVVTAMMELPAHGGRAIHGL